MPETDASDVLTSQHLESVLAVLNQGDSALDKLKTKSGQDIEYFKKAYKRLSALQETLTNRVVDMEAHVGTMARQDASYNGLLKQALAYTKEVKEESEKQGFVTYYFGSSKVASDAALENKIKAELPPACKGNASQALNDVIKGSPKDASKAGSGVKHASAGKKGVSSCTVFAKIEEEQDGLETVVKVVGVGSHSGNTSYDIYWSSVSGLKVGTVFTL